MVASVVAGAEKRGQIRTDIDAETLVSSTYRCDMNEVRTEITIEAPVERIWELLADFDLYPHWNPLFQRATGRLNDGEQLELVVTLPEIPPFVVSPVLLAVEPGSGFCWQHTLLFGAFTWKYCVELEILAPDRLKFVQSSRFGGILAPFFKLGLGTSVAGGLGQMNQAIRRWGEKGNIQCLKC
jgi:hypothetical protein